MLRNLSADFSASGTRNKEPSPITSSEGHHWLFLAPFFDI